MTRYPRPPSVVRGLLAATERRLTHRQEILDSLPPGSRDPRVAEARHWLEQSRERVLALRAELVAPRAPRHSATIDMVGFTVGCRRVVRLAEKDPYSPQTCARWVCECVHSGSLAIFKGRELRAGKVPPYCRDCQIKRRRAA